jgi:hypothetical protein
MTTQTDSDPKKAKARSPAYPAFSLAVAIDLARKLWAAQRKQETHIDSALKSLGYSARSGTALRTIAGLNHYGLIEESGSKDERKIKLSERAQDIIHLAENDPRRKEALAAAARAPAIYDALWERYGDQLPDDSAIRPFLIRDKGYNDAAVDDLLADYRATLEFAKPDKMSEDVPYEENRDKTPKDALRFKKTSSQAGGSMTLEQELPILVGANRVARIPFPMTTEDFDLLLETLNVWKKRIVIEEIKPSQEVDDDFKTYHGTPYKPADKKDET